MKAGLTFAPNGRGKIPDVDSVIPVCTKVTSEVSEIAARAVSPLFHSQPERPVQSPVDGGQVLCRICLRQHRCWDELGQFLLPLVLIVLGCVSYDLGEERRDRQPGKSSHTNIGKATPTAMPLAISN